ncbi:MAG TPA: choice-of-anchor Q domain-containing protein, partial [Blastocatellia bacterium]
MRHTLFSTIHSMTSQATRRTALAILALALALFCGSGPSAKRATTESDFSGNSAKLRGRAALDYLKQQGVYDSLEAANINSTITQVKQVTASDGAADDELGYAVAVDGDTLVVGAYQCTVGANNKGNAVAFPMTITSSCPTSFMVNDLGDAVDATPGNSVCATAGGVCTLRAAIQEANAIGATCSPLTINFSVTGTITLGSALPALDHPNLTITGPGTSSLTVSGATLYRPFTINSGKVVAISGLTVANGFNVTQAGGIENNGTLTINNCAIRNNKSGQSGGIQNNGTLVMNNCTVHGNMSTGFGGGIASFGSFTTTLNNCTISGNTATADAAGLATGGTWFLTNCTVVNNTAGSVGGGIEIYSANVTLKNTIVANNTSSSIPATGNLDGSVNLNSASSFNLIGTGNTLGLTNGVNGNITGVTTPLLGTFATYGGTTQTIPLLPGSPAINAGTASGAPTTDQRGKARFGTTDIGAFESQGFTLTVGNGDNQSAAVNTAFAAPLVVNVDAINSTDSEPVNGGRVTFTVPGSGASCSLATNPATISSGSASAGTATANGIAGGPYMVTATTGAGTLDFNLTNTAPQAVFTFSVASTNFNEAVGMAFFSIQRANTGVPVSVGYATGGGTATAGACAPGVDYVAASGTMNFGANEMNKTFSVTICNDTVYEANQTFNVTLSNPMGGTIGTTGTVIATIRNDDAAPTVAINDLSNAEGNSGTTNFQTTFTVSGASEVAG